MSAVLGVVLIITGGLQAVIPPLAMEKESAPQPVVIVGAVMSIFGILALAGGVALIQVR